MIRLALSTAALAAASVSSASAQALKPMAADGVVAAISDCVAAMESTGVDDAQLSGRGWRKASVVRDDKPVEALMGFYSKAGSGALVMTNAKPGSRSSLCIVTAKLEQAKQYQAVVDGIDSLEGMRAVNQDKLKIHFISNHHVIQSELVGSKADPTVKIAVGAVPEKK